MIILIPSVMHTGRHVLATAFSGWKTTGPVIDELEEESRYIMLLHLTDKDKILYQHIRDFPAVVPIRHPVRVWESWKRKQSPQMTFQYFEEQWKNLIRVKDHLISYVFIDEDRRDKDLEKAGRLAGARLKTDWPVLSQTNTVDFEVTQERVKEIPDWIMEHYYGIH